MRSTASRTANLTDSLIDRPLKPAGVHQNQAKKKQTEKRRAEILRFLPANYGCGFSAGVLLILQRV
jgi:hypothetical protein